MVRYYQVGYRRKAGRGRRTPIYSGRPTVISKGYDKRSDAVARMREIPRLTKTKKEVRYGKGLMNL